MSTLKCVNHAVNTNISVQCRVQWHHEHVWSMPSTPVNVYSVEQIGTTKMCGACRQHQYMCTV